MSREQVWKECLCCVFLSWDLTQHSEQALPDLGTSEAPALGAERSACAPQHHPRALP